MVGSNNPIADLIQRRNIQWLCHFTPRRNLENIKREGLRPRNLINGSYTYTDIHRYDQANNSICLSISQPNIWMLKNKRKEGVDLCLLLINPSVLYEKECLFYPHNAATKCYRGLPFEQFKGIEALERLFDDKITYQKSGYEPQTISRFCKKDFLTTSEQAEVQCLEIIEKEYIDYIIEDSILLDYIIENNILLDSKELEGGIIPFGQDKGMVDLSTLLKESETASQDNLEVSTKSETVVPPTLLKELETASQDNLEVSTKSEETVAPPTLLKESETASRDNLEVFTKSEETVAPSALLKESEIASRDNLEVFTKSEETVAPSALLKELETASQNNLEVSIKSEEMEEKYMAKTSQTLQSKGKKAYTLEDLKDGLYICIITSEFNISDKSSDSKRKLAEYNYIKNIRNLVDSIINEASKSKSALYLLLSEPVLRSIKDSLDKTDIVRLYAVRDYLQNIIDYIHNYSTSDDLFEKVCGEGRNTFNLLSLAKAIKTIESYLEDMNKIYAEADPYCKAELEKTMEEFAEKNISNKLSELNSKTENTTTSGDKLYCYLFIIIIIVITIICIL